MANPQDLIAQLMVAQQGGAPGSAGMPMPPGGPTPMPPGPAPVPSLVGLLLAQPPPGQAAVRSSGHACCDRLTRRCSTMLAIRWEEERHLLLWVE